MASGRHELLTVDLLKDELWLLLDRLSGTALRTQRLRWDTAQTSARDATVVGVVRQTAGYPPYKSNQVLIL